MAGPLPRPYAGVVTAALRRRLALLLAALSMVGLLSGCGSFGQTLSQSELIVLFQLHYSKADVQRVREACDGAGGAQAEPPGPDNAMNRSRPLRFDVTGLDVHQRAKLVKCLSADPAVRGYEETGAEGA